MKAARRENQTHAAGERDAGRLKTYVKLKLAVARQVRGVAHEVETSGARELVDACHELMTKLAEDRFTLAVVGQFKRGKSSLMNAVVGRELLPTGVLPLTSAITILRFGPAPRLVVSREGWAFEEEAPISELPSYVTETANPGNRLGVKAVYVEFPSPFLRRGLEFVDTPGIGSAIEANTVTTCRFIPSCDAVLFVTAADAPLAAAEADFLSGIRQHVRKIFFVVNKTDLLTAAEREDVLAFVRRELARMTDGGPVRLFPVSARLALSAKAARDAAGLTQSGLPALELALADFLADDRTTVFLVAILDRADHLLADLGTQAARARQAAVRKLRERILAGERPTSLPAADRPSPAPARPSSPPEPWSTTSTLAHLGSARTCPICQQLARGLFDFFAQWQYLLSSDEASQAAFADERGFCSLHTWQLAAVASPQGLSAGYALLLERLSSAIEPLAAADDPGVESLLSLTADRTTCRVCRALVDAEHEQVRRLADDLAMPATRDAYARSRGVCLRHLGPLLVATPDVETRQFLLGEAARQFDELTEDMQSYAIKHEGTRRFLQNRDERDAWLRGLIQVVGQKSLCAPWEVE